MAVFGSYYYRMWSNCPLIYICVIWVQPDKFCLGGAEVFSVDSGLIGKKETELLIWNDLVKCLSLSVKKSWSTWYFLTIVICVIKAKALKKIMLTLMLVEVSRMHFGRCFSSRFLLISEFHLLTSRQPTVYYKFWFILKPLATGV